MGCTAGTVIQQSETVSLDGVDLSKRINKQVPDFKFAQERLQEVDIDAIIEKGELWEDDTFLANQNSILDKSMSHQHH